MSPPTRLAEKVLAHAEQRLVLKPGARPADMLGAYKQFLKLEEHRVRLAHKRGASGRTVAQSRAQMMDVLLRHLLAGAQEHYHHQHPDAALPPLALLAIGGYGRGELSPYSDVDIMFLHSQPSRGTPDPGLTEVVEQVLYLLWDTGLKVGHSTRSISEAVAQANQDMQSKTALIESRLISGVAKLHEDFRAALLKDCVRGHVEEYVAARMRDQGERHEKYGDSVYMQEPNVKNGCGGLRDFQNLIWMAFFKHGALSLDELKKQGIVESAEKRDLENAYEFILRIRNALHYLTGRATEVIGLGLQPQLASEFGYRHHDLLRRMEAFMRDYYTQARHIFLLTNELAERLALKPAKTRRLSALLGRKKAQPELLDGFVVGDGLIGASEPGIFRQDPLRLMRVVLHAQQRDLEFSPELRTRLRQELHLVNRSFQHSTAVRDVFFEILLHKGQVARILRLMHQTEFLGKYLPEFGRLTCLVQHEFFHRYTADEHTLQVVDHLDRIIDATQPPHANYRKIFQDLDHPHVLYLALLLHDTGKAANVDHHAEASVEYARGAATRLQMNEDEKTQLLFLVRDHLKLSMLSQRRDLDDQSTIDAAARIVKTDSNLDMLHLLTFADAAGTSIKTWSDWKEALLWELYHRTKQTLTGPERAKNILARRIEQLYQEVSAKLKSQLPLEEIYSHFELMPASYYIKTNADRIAEHLLLIHDFLKRQLEFEKPEDALAPVAQWSSAPTQGFSQVTICTWDRLGLFYKICAAFAAAELNILRARIYTRGDHVVLDVFDVCDREHQAVTDETTVQTAETLLTRTLSLQEEIDFHEVVNRIRSRRPPAPRIREVTIPTIIRFDNEISQNRTVIEIQTEDQIGLLYALTKTMSDLNLDISIAKIATEKGAAIDSFYVQDHRVGKITDPHRLDQIQRKLEDAIRLLSS